jgi:hypothetical protein
MNTPVAPVQSEEDIARALDIARSLIEAGIPVFVAGPDDSPLGFKLPTGWQTSRPTLDVLNRWKPGKALCALGGVGADFLDVDPRNGGKDGQADLVASGAWPATFGRQRTPSGGTHDVIVPLGVGKGKPAKGVDLQGGCADGTGRGFAFIAPTVRISKVTGEPTPYVWLDAPDTDALTDARSEPLSAPALSLAARTRGTSPTSPTSPGDPFSQPSREPFSQVAGSGEVLGRVIALGQQLAAAPVGQGNDTAASIAYKVGGYVAEGQLDAETAYGILWGALSNWTWRNSADRNVMESTIRRQIAAASPRAWQTSQAVTPYVFDGEVTTDVHASRVMDLSAFLDGSYVAPTPSLGAERDDARTMLYPGKWHTVVALTGAGKSWFALWHCIAEMRAGRTVVYAHFEEGSPAGTIGRLLQLLVGRSTDPARRASAVELIRERFKWLNCERRWSSPEEFSAALAEAAPGEFSLLALDGINAACSQHGLLVDKPEAVGAYRALFVAPAARRGAAVLSLGHPPKAKDRQGERHGFGSSAWLDEVDGVGFRLVAARTSPIRRGSEGASDLYSVKDRYGEVEMLGHLEEKDSMEGFTYLGRFRADDRPERENTVLSMSRPATNDKGVARDAFDVLGDAVLKLLAERPEGFTSAARLTEKLQADGVKFGKTDLTPALTRLADDGKILWPEAPKAGLARPVLPVVTDAPALSGLAFDVTDIPDDSASTVTVISPDIDMSPAA